MAATESEEMIPDVRATMVIFVLAVAIWIVFDINGLQLDAPATFVVGAASTVLVLGGRRVLGSIRERRMTR